MSVKLQPEESRRIDLCFLVSFYNQSIVEELEKLRALAESKGFLVASSSLSFNKIGKPIGTPTFDLYEQVNAFSCNNVLVFDLDPTALLLGDREVVKLAKNKGRRVDFISKLPLFGDSDGFPIDLSHYRTDGGKFFGEKAFLKYLDTLKKESEDER